MDIFSLNLEILKKQSEILYNQVINEKDLYNVEVEYNENWEVDAIEYNQKYVHMYSAYSRENELEMICKSLTGDEETVLIFGLGNGDILKFLKKKYTKIKKILVIEPSLSIFKRFLSQCNILEFLQGISVSFLVNRPPNTIGEEVGRYLNDDKTKMLHHLSYRIVFEDYYMELLNVIKDNLIIRYGNYNFQRVYKNLIINFVSNIKYNNEGISILENELKGKPLIVVAAGPSLNKNMHYLKELYNKAIIVAVGSAIKILDSNGIEPHLRMALDPFPIELKVVKDINTKSSPLLYTNNLFYDVLRLYEGPKIPFNLLSDYGKRYLNKKQKKEYALLNSGSSVAIPAVDMGVKLGSSKIIIMGFDAAFQLGEMYADGIGDGREDEIQALLSSSRIFETVDIYGNKIFTDKGFYMNKIGMETVVKANPNLTFYDCTEGGLKIEGTVIKNLKDVIETELTEIYKVDLLSKFGKLECITNENLSIIYDTMLKEIEQIEDALEPHIKRLKKLKKYLDKKIQVNSALLELKKMDGDILGIEKIDLFSEFIFPNLESIFCAIKDKFRYNGFDNVEEAQKRLECQLGIAAQIYDFCDFLKFVVNQEIEGTLYEHLKQVFRYDA